ncbi:proline-rich acidic protein 1 [Phascolarctos cinereus]|uniref:Proline-rich acidic protein 1 n=1 Tax=Phascolarctos cinereus TaxID=38626 RepID=A0A6P5KWC5_PHACI|nr:proline-rich acidic protein 1 [Phascolarctos cinereus]
MKRLILLASLAVLLLQVVHGASKYQVLMNAKRKDSFSEENPNKQLNLGPKAVEQSEKDNLLTEPRRELFTDWEENQDTDILRRFRNLMQLPEEDRDVLYHSRSTEDIIGEPKMLRKPSYEVLQGPEEDRDHIYHAED